MDESSIKVGNIELENLNDTYCLITVGTDITSSIQDLNMKTFKHSHNREFGEQPISFKDLVGATEEDGLSGVFVESRHDGNYLPQYLHRDGYSGSESYLNDQNAMRGPLVIGKKTDASGADTVPGGRVGGSGTSYGLFFNRWRAEAETQLLKSEYDSSGNGTSRVKSSF